jgi:hypothetical protein
MVLLSLIIALKFDFPMMLLFLLIGGLIPSILAGAEFNLNTVLFLGHVIVLNLVISALNPSFNVLQIIYPIMLGMMMISITTLSNENMMKRISVPVVAIIVNMVYLGWMGGLIKIV